MQQHHQILKKLDAYSKREMKKYIKIFNLIPEIFETQIKAGQTIESLNLQFTPEQKKLWFFKMNSAAVRKFDLKYHYPINDMAQWALEEALVEYNGLDFKRIYKVGEKTYDNESFFSLTKKEVSEIHSEARLIEKEIDQDVCTKCNNRNTAPLDDKHECYDCGETY